MERKYWQQLKKKNSSFFFGGQVHFPVDLAIDSPLSWPYFNLWWLEIAFYWEFKSLIQTPMWIVIPYLILATRQSNGCSIANKDANWNNGAHFIGFIGRKIIFIMKKKSYSSSLVFKNGSHQSKDGERVALMLYLLLYWNSKIFKNNI